MDYRRAALPGQAPFPRTRFGMDRRRPFRAVSDCAGVRCRVTLITS